MIKDTMLPFAISKELRAMAERGVEQAKLAFGNYTQASEEAVSTFEQWVEVNRANAQNNRKKVMNFAQRNVLSAFEFTQKVVRAKDIEELIQAQTEFVQSQMQDLGEQVKELGEAATVSFMDRVKDLSGNITKAAIKNVKHLGATASKAAVALEKVEGLGEAA